MKGQVNDTGEAALDGGVQKRLGSLKDYFAEEDGVVKKFGDFLGVPPNCNIKQDEFMEWIAGEISRFLSENSHLNREFTQMALGIFINEDLVGKIYGMPEVAGNVDSISRKIRTGVAKTQP